MYSDFKQIYSAVYNTKLYQKPETSPKKKVAAADEVYQRLVMKDIRSKQKIFEK